MRPAPPNPALPPLDQLRDVVAKLRGPGGCPWDREQTHRTLRAGLLEEAYEVAAAIDAGDDANLCEELGDLLHSRSSFMRSSPPRRAASISQMSPAASAKKLVRRHPHVFAAEHATDAAAVLVRWDEIKRAEKGLPAGDSAPSSALDGVPAALPALLHAHATQKKAGKIGFDWPDAPPIIAKVREELAEIEQAMADGDSIEIEREIGDLLFSVVNLARKLRIDPELALRGFPPEKFTTRFSAMEGLARRPPDRPPGHHPRPDGRALGRSKALRQPLTGSAAKNGPAVTAHLRAPILPHPLKSQRTYPTPTAEKGLRPPGSEAVFPFGVAPRAPTPKTDGCQSGRLGTPGKRVYFYRYRGFESRPIRQRRRGGRWNN